MNFKHIAYAIMHFALGLACIYGAVTAYPQYQDAYVLFKAVALPYTLGTLMIWVLRAVDDEIDRKTKQ